MKTSTTRLIALALLAASCWGTAQAQTKKELVQKLLLLQRPSIEALARQLAEQPALQIADSARRVLAARVPADKREATAKAADAELKKYLDESVPLVREKALQQADLTLGPLLEERFSEDELKQLIAWIDSPLNRKYLQIAPELQSTLAQKVVAEARPQIEPRVRQLDANLAKLLGVPPAPAAAAPAAPAKKGTN
ncbi:MAG: DUF2059 domain-containing protein [Burkholderiales bacterium]|nr:DUF2059 domain-containing protein [Burkholderiales bacterium]